MEKQLHQIWDGIAQIEVPMNFVEATVGERRKIYGMAANIPTYMLIDREQRVFISAAKDEQMREEDAQKDISELAQNFNYTLTRNVPGYKCMGIFQKKIEERSACAIQYTFYAQEFNRYTILLAIRDKENLYILNFVCNNDKVPQMHPIFLEIIDSISFKNEISNT